MAASATEATWLPPRFSLGAGAEVPTRGVVVPTRAAAAATTAPKPPPPPMWAMFQYNSRRLSLLGRDEASHVTLALREWEVATLARVTTLGGVSWAPLGLVGMLNGGGALEATQLRRAPPAIRPVLSLNPLGHVHASAQLSAAGEFGAYCQPAPRAVRVNGVTVDTWTHDAASGLLQVPMARAAEAAEVVADF